MKIGAGASCDNDGRDTAYFIEKTGSFNKRSDGFFLTAYHPLHQFVPDHKISGTGVFIDEEREVPLSIPSMTLAAWEVLPLASSV